MQIGKKKISGSVAILLLAVMLTATVVGSILYTLTMPATWNVRVAQGLELDYANGTKVTALSFTVDQWGNQTQSFILKNLANHAVNVTQTMPATTSTYQFTTTFANNTIVQGATYAFSLTLIDLGMTDTTTYSGNFAYNIVSGFSQGSSADTFSTTIVNYASDSAQYFSFVNDGFNASSYPLGSTVLYHFTTENINQTYEIQGLTYKLEVYDSSNNLVNTVCDGLLVAYWQNSTAYGTFGNGTHMTDVPLLPNQEITIWNSFAAPSPAGTYHLSLTYQSHNAAPISPPETPITWTVNVVNPWSSSLSVIGPLGYGQPTITGATQTNEAGTIAFQIKNVGGNSWESCDITVTVPELGITIASQSSGQINQGQTKSYSYGFTMTTGGSLTMQVTLSNRQTS